MTEPHYIPKSRTGRAPHAFHDPASDIAVREQRRAQSRHADRWEVKTTETKVRAMTDKPTVTQDYHAATKAFDNVLGHAAGYAEYGGMSDREAGVRSLTQDLANHREASVA